MLIGYNNDVEYRGKTFHIQTEDHGAGDPRIETQIFHQGAIMDTRITSYESVLEEHDGKVPEEKIRSLMKASHKSLFKKLMAGEYDEFAGLEPLDEVPDDALPSPEEFNPSHDGVPAAAQELEAKAQKAANEEEEDDVIMEFAKEQAEEHVDLSELKGQLGDLDDDDIGQFGADDDDLIEDEAPTQVTNPSELDGFGDLDVDDPSEGAGAPAASASADQSAEPTPRMDWEPTGVTAWTGCADTDEDLSITGLVEAFIAG